MVPLHGQVSALLQGVDCMSAMLLTRSWSRMEVTPHPRRGKNMSRDEFYLLFGRRPAARKTRHQGQQFLSG